MRVLKRNIAGKDGEGTIQVQADESEDIYHLFNIICEGDLVVASTIRNVVKESNTGSTQKSRMKMTLKIRVEKIEFDSEQCSLRLNGKNVEENEFVKLGQYHTLDLEVGRPFKIEKPCWDSIFLEMLDDACNPAKKAELAALVMQEGLAHLCLVTNSMTITRAKIEKRIPKKTQGNSAYDKSRVKFFEEIYEAVKKYIDFDVVKVVIVGSPGFLKDDFMKFLLETATRVGDVAILKQKSKFLKAHASSGYKKAIDELLGDAALRSQLADVKAADEVRALQTFYDLLSSDPDRACYGFADVNCADDQLAIDGLLVTDKLFKAADVHHRKKYVALVESVKEHGGRVFIFSSMHVSGEQLDLYTGVAATLRFPISDFDAAIADSAAHAATGASSSSSSSALKSGGGKSGSEGKSASKLSSTADEANLKVSAANDDDSGSDTDDLASDSEDEISEFVKDMGLDFDS